MKILCSVWYTPILAGSLSLLMHYMLQRRRMGMAKKTGEKKKKGGGGLPNQKSKTDAGTGDRIKIIN